VHLLTIFYAFWWICQMHKNHPQRWLLYTFFSRITLQIIDYRISYVSVTSEVTLFVPVGRSGDTDFSIIGLADM
jgi:hypothetical protein